MDEKKKRTVTGRISEARSARSALGNRLTPRRVASAMGVALAAFLLAGCRLPFSVYPLGVAFLCASTGNAIFAAVGVMASAFFSTLPWYVPFFTALGIPMIRLLGRLFLDAPVDPEGAPLPLAQRLRAGMFCEGLHLRTACSCVAAFSMSLTAIIGGGFQYYDLFGALLSMVVAPISTLLFSGLFAGEAERYASVRRDETVRNISYVALSLALCFSLTQVQIPWLSAAVVFSFAATLWGVRRHGLIASLAVGALCGATIALPYSFVLSVAAFTAFCVQDRSASFASAVGCVAGTVGGVLVMGVDDLGGLFLPMLVGSAVYTLAEKGAEQRCLATEKTERAQEPTIPDAFSSNDRVADAMAGLSSTFLALCERTISEEDAETLCHACLEELCRDCRRFGQCGESASAVSESARALSDILLKRGEIGTEDVSLCQDGCPHAEKVVRRVNQAFARAMADRERPSCAEIFAEDYAAMAAMLRGMAQKGREETAVDGGCRAALLAELNGMGYPSAAVSVTGTRHKRVCLSSLGETDPNQLDRLSDAIADVCGFPVFLTLQSDGQLTATRRPVFDAVYGSGFLAGEDICGDVVAVFRDDEGGYLYALLNDGMGAGRDAAFTARLASLFLRKLLPAGVDVETAVRMLHCFLRLGYNRGTRESSTTVDLLTLDRFDGRIRFVKSGAAPTYVKRGNHVFCLASTTVPVGILPETDTAEIDFQAKDGDVIVMVSDGIHDGDGECPWLVEYLEKATDEEPSAMADRLVAYAAAQGGRDDLSVIVLRVQGNL